MSDRATNSDGHTSGGDGLLQAKGLTKAFLSGGASLTVLAGLDLTVHAREMVAVIGPSGSGKSTLLHLLGALDAPTSGGIYFAGRMISALGAAEQAEYRNGSVGFVWQRHHLLPDFTAAENVAMPLLLRGGSPDAALARAGEWLGRVGLAGRAEHRAGELSGGEQQRVAIARALVAGPQLLLADEPTGDLDEGNTEEVFQLLQRLLAEHGLTAVLATHNLSLARRCHRVLALEHGILVPRDAGVKGQAQGTRG
jgi:lipoprotein-releasing system ATP-binding protein